MTDVAWTRWQRFQLSLIGWVGYIVISLIGRTVRWESVGSEHLEQIHSSGRRAIFTFWHGRIFPATWFWRRRGIVVMTSMNFDGEGIARCIHRFGYGSARGSSSRGGFRALAEMARAIRNGRDAAFTVDGPRGPRYQAKPGPVILAMKTGAAVLCFNPSMERKIQLRSWDHFQIPIPFTRAVVLQSPPIWVPEGSSEEELRGYHDQVQRALDELRERGDSWWQKNGRPETGRTAGPR